MRHAQRRAAVGYLQERFGFSQRRACRLVGTAPHRPEHAIRQVLNRKMGIGGNGDKTLCRRVDWHGTNSLRVNLPDALNAVQIEGAIGTDNRYAFYRRLGDHQSIKWIAVVKRET